MLRKAIDQLGVRGVARELGVSPAYVSMLARGKRAMTGGVQERLTALVNIHSVHNRPDQVSTKRGSGRAAPRDRHEMAPGDPPRFRTENLLIKSQLLYH